jgi:hypothetical protein
LPKPLANYQPELLGRRMTDRVLLRSVLQNKGYYALLTPFQELFFRIAVIERIIETQIQNAEKDPDLKSQPPPPSTFRESFRQLVQSDESLRDVLADLLGSPEKTENEFTRLARQLETGLKKQTAQGEPPDPSELLALALLKAKTERLEEVVPLLDELELKSPQDAKSRELIAANIGLQLKKEKDERNLSIDERNLRKNERTLSKDENDLNKNVRQRTETALDRLLGYRLSDQEAFNLLPILEQWGRSEDAQLILDRLVASATDRRIQNELLHRMQVAGDAQKENAVKISLRVLRNPKFFSDSRHFALDSYLYETALKILREYGEVGTVAEQLEVRFKGLKEKTDSLIMLANLYLATNRQNEAKELALELSRNPSRETDRRNAITTLLQHFSLTKQLEEMNERLLERNHQQNQ